MDETMENPVLPSERAKLYYEETQKYRALWHEGCEDNSKLLSNNAAVAEIAQRVGMSSGQIRRYIRLYTKATGQLWQLVDQGKISVRTADELTFLPAEKQNLVCNVLQQDKRRSIGCKQAEILKTYGDSLTEEDVKRLLPPLTFTAGKIPVKQLKPYFPANFSLDQMANVIFNLLDEWQEKQAEGRD